MGSDLACSHDLFCFACGKHNPHGFQLKFLSEQPGCARSHFIPEVFHQSYADTLHGGIQSLILDACMVQAVKSLGVECVTGKLEIRYQSPVSLKSEITILAEIEKRMGQFFVVTAQIQQGMVTTTKARGVYKYRE